MKIGILTHNYPRTKNERKDAGVFLMDFANEVSKKFDVAIFTPDFGGMKEDNKEVPVTWFEWGGPYKKLGDWNILFPTSIWFLLKLFVVGSKKVVQFVKINHIDYNLAAWSIPSGIYAYWAKKVLGTPYGVWNLGSDINKYARYPILRQIVILILKNADHVYANSYDLVEKVGKISGKKVFMLPAITEFNSVRKNVVNEITNQFKFLFVGRLEKVKGPDILLDAVNLISKNHPDLNFSVDILGGGSMEKEIKDGIRRLDLLDKINMIGWADGEMVAKFIQTSSCLLVPSRSESLPIVMLEAAKSNLPVIASDVGDCPFLVKKYKIGFSFANQDSGAMANCMRKIINLEKVNKLGFSRLIRDYSLEKTVKFFTEKVIQVTEKK